jgi:hypothetical protein
MDFLHSAFQKLEAHTRSDSGKERGRGGENLMKKEADPHVSICSVFQKISK